MKFRAAALLLVSITGCFAASAAASVFRQGISLENARQIEVPVPAAPVADKSASPLAAILREADGGYMSPARETELLGRSELLFDPYTSFSRRYQILSGSPFDRALYDSLNQGAAVNFDSCPSAYPGSPQLKEVFIIMWVIVDDYTGRTLECLIRHHLARGTRVRLMIGEFFLTGFLKKKLDGLNKLPFFEYKTIAGDFTGLIKNKNMAPHYKSMAVIGANTEDSAVIVGGRNLSDRYYFNDRPGLEDYLSIGQRPEGNNAGAGIFNDFDIYIRDHRTALDALDISRVLWNRLSNNFTFDLRLPLEDQLRILYNSKEYSILKPAPAADEHSGAGGPPPQPQNNYWLDRVDEDLGVLKKLSATEHEGRTVHHYEGLGLVPKLSADIDGLLGKYSEREIEEEVIRSGGKAPDDLKKLSRAEVSPSNGKLTNFRIELYRKFEASVKASGLFEKVSRALDGAWFKPKFREWYDGVYKAVDRMLFKKELFSKVRDLTALFFKPDEGSGRTVLASKPGDDALAADAKEYDTLKEAIARNNTDYGNQGYGASQEALGKLLNSPGFAYKDDISFRDFIYKKYYAQEQDADAGEEKPFFRYFASVPGQNNLKMEKLFVDLINASKKTVRFANCFFHPTPAIMTALRQAALRGVQVYVTTNVSFAGDDDVSIPEQANAKAINSVVGLPNFHFYRWDGTILHAKVYAFDEEAVFIGSTNMNTRTFLYNGENGVFVHDRAFTANYIETIYNTHFINTGKHPFPNIQVSRITGPVPEKGVFTRWFTAVFNRYL